MAWGRKKKKKEEKLLKAMEGTKPEAEAPPPEESPYGKPKPGPMGLKASSGRYGYWNEEGDYVPYKNGHYTDDGVWVAGKSTTYGSYSSSYYRSWYGDDDDDRDYSSYFGKKEKGKSSSSFWSSRFTSYSWSSSAGPDYVTILNSVRRSANILANARDEAKGERELRVEWSDGTQANSAGEDVIYVSPDVVTPGKTRKRDWTEDERTDVLIGEALCESTLRRTMDPKVESAMAAALDQLKGQLEHTLWNAAERVEAETQVVSEYPGFKGYFAAHRDYYTEKNAQKNLQDRLDTEENAVHATLALLWEMLHPSDHLKMPPKTEELVKKAFESFSDTQDSQERAYKAKAAIADFIREWPLPELEGQPELADNLKSVAEGSGMPTSTRGECVAGSEAAVKAAETEKKTLEELSALDGDVGDDTTADILVRANMSDVTEYRRIVRAHSDTIEALKRRLKFRNEIAKITEHGLRRGDIDEGSLYKLGFYPHGVDDPNLFEEKEIFEPPQIAFCLLVDESGSMSSGRMGMPRYMLARDTAITLASALRGLKGIHFSVLGHTAEGYGQHGGHHGGLILHHYYTPEKNTERDLAAMAKIGHFSQNIDGYALAKSALYMKRWYPSIEKRILIHISDGYPCGDSYGGPTAERHMRKVVETAAKEGVEILAIGIDNAYTEAAGSKMYGSGRCTVIDKASALPVVANLISKYALEKRY